MSIDIRNYERDGGKIMRSEFISKENSSIFFVYAYSGEKDEHYYVKVHFTFFAAMCLVDGATVDRLCTFPCFVRISFYDIEKLTI